MQGEINDLKNDLIDENLKGIDEWFERQNRYSRKDAEHELHEDGKSGVSALLSADPLARRAALKRLARRLPSRGVIYFLYAYIWRRGFLDGRDGLTFCVMRAMYQSMVSIKKYDACRLRNAQQSQPFPVPRGELQRAARRS